MADHESLDILDGAERIAQFLGVPSRRAYYLCASKQIPCWKLGAKWMARKSTLTKHIERLEAGEAA